MIGLRIIWNKHFAFLDVIEKHLVGGTNSGCCQETILILAVFNKYLLKTLSSKWVGTQPKQIGKLISLMEHTF